MVIAIVSFPLPEPKTLPEMTELFRSSAPKYLRMPGLVRKNYFLTEDGTRAGGIYIWASREAAERCYSPDWVASVTATYGAAPEIVYVHSPVAVDNQSDEITHG